VTPVRWLRTCTSQGSRTSTPTGWSTSISASVASRTDAGPALVSVHREAGRLRTRLRSGLLRPQPLHGPADRCRIGLLATTALLLGGDAVDLEVEVGPGVTLELSDVAGTVAYDGRGHPATWTVRVRVAEGGRLRWSGEPFVVADGADVTRTLSLELADGAVALVRETVVLGRTGQLGGVLRNRATVLQAGLPVLVEDTELDPATHRRLPGMLGELRVVDTLLALGTGAPGADAGGVTAFRLAGTRAHLLRHLGPDLAGSPLHQVWAGTRLD
jgi:urease accessory protein